MAGQARTWVVVADSGRAQLFVPDEDKTRLVQRDLPDFEPPSISHYAREVISDRPTRSFSSAGGGVRHAVELRQDPHIK